MTVNKRRPKGFLRIIDDFNRWVRWYEVSEECNRTSHLNCRGTSIRKHTPRGPVGEKISAWKCMCRCHREENKS